MINTGNEKVDKMHEINITGNVTPPAWYKTITRDSGKPYLQAIIILSDLVYWYKPTEVRDEASGKIIGYKRKFKGDKLQRTYDSIAEEFGISKNDAVNAIKFLEELGAVKREFRTVMCGEIKCNNVLFIDINPEKIAELTFEKIDTYTQNLGGGVGKNWGEVTPKNGGTNTKTTTNTSTKISNSKKEEARTIDDIISEQKETLQEPLREFVKMRKAIKKPITTHGLDLAIKELHKLTTNISEAVEIINQSVMNSWQGFYIKKPQTERANQSARDTEENKKEKSGAIQLGGIRL